LIIAGANGSGKTTFAPFLHQLYDIEESVNPDVIAAGLSLHPESVALQSGRIALTGINDLISQNKSFAYETTLASHTAAHILQKINRENYHTSLHFLVLPSDDAAKNRVKRRVEQGGHDIPAATIERRFKRGLENFFNIYSELVDEWSLYNAFLPDLAVIAYNENKLTTVLNEDVWLALEKKYDRR
jgi:predicted ABC-type ATPase